MALDELKVVDVQINEKKSVEVQFLDSSNIVSNAGFVYRKVGESTWHKDIRNNKISEKFFKIKTTEGKEKLKSVVLDIVFPDPFTGSYEYRVALFDTEGNILITSENDNCFFRMPEVDLDLKIVLPKDVIIKNNKKISLKSALSFVYEMNQSSPLGLDSKVIWFIAKGDVVDNGLLSDGGLISNRSAFPLLDPDVNDVNEAIKLLKKYSLEKLGILEKGVYTLIVAAFKEDEINEAGLLDQDCLLFDAEDSSMDVELKITEIVELNDTMVEPYMYNDLVNGAEIELRDGVDHEVFWEANDPSGSLDSILVNHGNFSKKYNTKKFVLRFDSPWTGKKVVELVPLDLNGNPVGHVFRLRVTCIEGDRDGVRFKFLSYQDATGKSIGTLVNENSTALVSKLVYDIGVNVFNFTGNLDALEFGYVHNKIEDPLLMVSPLDVSAGISKDISFKYNFNDLDWKGELILYVKGVIGTKKGSPTYTAPSFIRINASGVDAYLSDYQVGVKPYGVKFGQTLPLRVTVEDLEDKVGYVTLEYQCKGKGSFISIVDYPAGEVLKEGTDFKRVIGKDFSLNWDVNCDDDFVLILRAMDNKDDRNILSQHKVNFELLEVASATAKFSHKLNSEGICEISEGDFNLVVEYDNSVGIATELYVKYGTNFLGIIRLTKGVGRLVFPYNFKLLKGWSDEREFVTGFFDDKGYNIGKGDTIRVKLVPKQSNESSKLELKRISAKKFDDYYLLYNKVGGELLTLKVTNKDKLINRVVFGEFTAEGIVELLDLHIDKKKNSQYIDVVDNFDKWWDGNKSVCFIGYGDDDSVVTNVLKFDLRLSDINVKLTKLDNYRVINKGDRYDIYGSEHEYEVVVNDLRKIIKYVRFGWYDEFGYYTYIDLKQDRNFKYEFKSKDLWSGDKHCFVVGIDKSGAFVGPLFDFILRMYTEANMAILLKDKYLARYLWWGGEKLYTNEEMLDLEEGPSLLQSFLSSLKVNQKNIYKELVQGSPLELKKSQYFGILKEAIKTFKSSDLSVYVRENSIRLLKGEDQYVTEDEIMVSDNFNEYKLNLLIGVNVCYVQLFYKTPRKDTWLYGMYAPHSGEKGIFRMPVDVDISNLNDEGELLLKFVPLGEDKVVIGDGTDTLKVKFINGKINVPKPSSSTSEVNDVYLDSLCNQIIKDYSKDLLEYLDNQDLNEANVGEYLYYKFDVDHSLSLNEQLMTALGRTDVELSLEDLSVLINKLVKKLKELLKEDLTKGVEQAFEDFRKI